MSHFTVMVIGNKYTTQLAPFQEADGKNMDEKYLEFISVEEESLAEYENDSAEMVVYPSGEKCYKHDHRFYTPNSWSIEREWILPEGCKVENIPHKEVYTTFEEFMDGWCGRKERDEQKEEYGYWKNPNAKWDWYELGGRWDGFFTLKNGKPSNQAKKKDIDFEKMKDDDGNAAAVRYDSVMGILGNSLSTFKSWKYFQELYKDDLKTARKEYGSQEAVIKIRSSEGGWGRNLEDFLISREEYIQNARNSAVTPFAVLNNGKWYERGEMGWWGIVLNEQDIDVWSNEVNKLLEELPEDTLLSIVDCHI